MKNNHTAFKLFAFLMITILLFNVSTAKIVESFDRFCSVTEVRISERGKYILHKTCVYPLMFIILFRRKGGWTILMFFTHFKVYENWIRSRFASLRWKQNVGYEC